LTTSPKIRLFFVLALFAILPLLAFPEIIFNQQTLYWSDLSWMHYPRHIFAAAEWLAGRVPLWDPYQHAGLPFLAESQVGALYPFSAVFLSPFSPSLELSAFILLHFTLAAGFTFALARRLGLAVAPAVVAGLSFGFGGFLMAQVANLNIMTGAVWLPLILLGLIEATRRRSWPAALLAGLPLALQIFTAQPQIVFYSLLTAAGYTLYRLVADFFGQNSARRGDTGYALRTATLALAVVVSGLLLAAPQWLATLELQQLSVRSQEKGLGFLTRNSLPPVMLLNLLLPGIFGNNVVGFSGGDPFQEDFIYIGLMPLLLLFFSPAQRHRREFWFFMGLLAGGLLLALGGHTPLYQLVIQHLPGFALFRIPARWLMVVNLALAVLAGWGFQTVLDKGITQRQLAAVVAAGLLAVGGCGVAWLWRDSLAADSKLWTAFFRVGYASHAANRALLAGLPWLTAPVFLLVTNVAAAVAVLAAWAWQKVPPAVFSGAVIGLVCLDLVAAGGTTINPTQPASWWQQLSGGARFVVDNVGAARVFPLGMGSERAATSHLGHYFPSVYRVRSAGGHGSSLMLARMSEFLHGVNPVPAIKVLGVRYLLTEGAMGADVAGTFPPAYSDQTSYVYENKTALPRVFVVHRLLQAKTPTETLRYLDGAEFQPEQTVVLETEAPLPPPGVPAGPSTAMIEAENPQHIEITVDAAADGYLVLLDTFYPGWQVTVDGQPAPIYRADYIARAVFVSTGKHAVVFDYRPFWFRLGVGLAVGFGLIVGFATIVARQKQGRELIAPD